MISVIVVLFVYVQNMKYVADIWTSMAYASKISYVIRQIKPSMISMSKLVYVWKVTEGKHTIEPVIIKYLFRLACLKFQCLSININNQTTCECANRRVPCDITPDEENMILSRTCELESPSHQKRELSWSTTYDGKDNTGSLE